MILLETAMLSCGGSLNIKINIINSLKVSVP
jgi:hypothetical protein